MEQYISYPIISTILSILLFLGSYQLGKIIINNLKLNNTIDLISTPDLLYPTFGFIFLLVILFPIVAFTNNANIILRFIGLTLIFFSFFAFFNIIKLLKKSYFFGSKDIFFYILIIFVVLYFFLSLSPLTSADVLDYHAGTALNILRLDQYKLFPEWFTGQQAGAGEVLIALGFSLGAEQFGSLVQFSAVLSITGIIIKFSEKNKLFKSNYFLILTILSCPILIFLLSGNKPQIFYSSILLVCFALNFINYKDQNEILKIYILINILLCCTVLGKFSFNLTGGIIWSYTTINFLNKSKNYKLLLVPIFIFILVYLPFLLWKVSNLGGNILMYIFNPFPLHLPGYENFLNHNKGSQEIPFPNFLFYTTPSRITEFLGFTSIFFIILILNFRQNSKLKFIILLIFFFLVVSNLYASPSARYYLDVILWTVFSFCFLKNLKYKKLIQYLFYPQIISVFVILVYSSYVFLPGAFSKESYLRIKNENAYMYSGMSWVNKNIPKNANVFIINRTTSLYKDFAVSGGFNYFTNSEESKFYKKKLKNYEIDYLVFFGPQINLMHMKNCVGEIFKEKKNVGFHATRNPFNKGGSYNAYIFYFDKDKLEIC